MPAPPLPPASPPPPPPPPPLERVVTPATVPPPPPPAFAPRDSRSLLGLKLLRPLRNRDFAFLWSGMTVSLIGDGVYFVSIPFLVFSLTDSATALSIAGAAWTLPQVLFLLLGGVVTDRFDRRYVLIASDVMRGVAVAGIAVLTLGDVLQLWHVYVLVAIYGIGEAFFLPAFGAIVPDVVPRDLLVEANSLDQFVRPFTLRLAGPALGGLLIATFGLGPAFVFDAATFVVSAVAVGLMSARPATVTDTSSPLSDMRDGFRYVRSQPWLLGGLLATAIGLFAFFGPWQVLVPLIVKEKLGGGASDFSFVVSAGGAGAILSALVVGQRGMARRPMLYVIVAWALGTLLLAGFAAADAVWQAMIAALLMIALLTAGQIVWATLQHQLVPRELLGRVSGFDWLVSTSLIPLSLILVGPLAEAVGANTTLLFAAAGGCVALLAFLLNHRLREVKAAA